MRYSLEWGFLNSTISSKKIYFSSENKETFVSTLYYRVSFFFFSCRIFWEVCASVQLLFDLFYFVIRRPSDWTVTWGGSGTIYGWGHNHRGQLGGIEGGKVKFPQPCEALSAIRPVQIVGGEQTLFAVTAEGKVWWVFYTCASFLFLRSFFQ